MAKAEIGAEVASNAGDIPMASNQVADPDAVRGSLAESRLPGMGADSMPYPPSWVDRLTEWVRRLPLPSWAFYLALGLISASLFTPLTWITGLVPEGTFPLYYVLSVLTGVYVLALLHYLDDSAAASLKRFRPVMAVDDAEYERLYYKFTTMPRRPVLVANMLGAIYAVILLLSFDTTDTTIAAGAMSPAQVAVAIVSFLFSYILTATMIYHTIHQLRLVNEIYTRYTRINLFQPGPMYALSRLTARTAIGLSIPTYAWFQATTGSSADAPGEMPFFAVLIALTFVWPLLGAHGLLGREKERLKDEVSKRIEATIVELQTRVDSGDVHDRGALKDTLEGLVASQGVIDKLRTWPWQTQTVSGLGAALLLPLIVWVIQRVLERLGI
ncbi:MAG TPA: hypothetical protein VGE04_13760 [Chloroflexia bacterium]